MMTDEEFDKAYNEMVNDPDYQKNFDSLNNEKGYQAYEGLEYMSYHLRELERIGKEYGINTMYKPLLIAVEASIGLLDDMAEELGLEDMFHRYPDEEIHHLLNEQEDRLHGYPDNDYDEADEEDHE